MTQLNSRTPLDRVDTLRFALLYAKRGFPVFPLHGTVLVDGEVSCGCHLGVECGRPGKHPANENGLRGATTDPVEVKGSWNAAAYDARRGGREPVPPNIAVAAGGGAGNLVVWDIDPKPPKGRAEVGVEWGWGFSSFHALEEEVGIPFPATLAVVTGSGGRHLWTRSSTPMPSRNGFRESLDVKAEGGYVVVPPSLHHSGARYHFLAPMDFSRIAALPQEWESMLQRHARTSAAGPRPKVRRKFGCHRAAMSLVEAKALLAGMLTHPLLEWATNEPDGVSRETWRGIATNFATLAIECPDLLEMARRAFHAISEDYSSYDARETDRTFADALQSAQKFGPMTFGRMRDAGAPDDCCSGGTSLIHAVRRAVIPHGRKSA